MTLSTSLRIDTAIQSMSYIRVLLYMSVMSAMLILAYFASLALWQYGLILVVLVATAIYVVMSRPRLLHLSQPPLNQRVDKQWQLLMRLGRGEQLWHAHLRAVHRYQWAIHFEFDVSEPYHRSLSATVFRDQVSAEQWRELSILANMMNH